MPSVIDVRQVDFAYRQQLVLKQIDLSVEAGSTIGIVGPNGGGKTTLVRLILGLLKPMRGTIRIDQLDPIRAVGRGDVIGYLPQNPSLAMNVPLNVRQVVRLGLAGKTGMLHAYARDDLDFVESLLERFGLGEISDDPIASLSGGQLQRVLIARAVAPRPRALVLDEPTTGIDAEGRRQFVDSMIELRAALGLTMLFVSHDADAVRAIAQKVIWINVTSRIEENIS